jgi:hypothetical protein
MSVPQVSILRPGKAQALQAAPQCAELQRIPRTTPAQQIQHASNDRAANRGPLISVR